MMLHFVGCSNESQLTASPEICSFMTVAVSVAVAEKCCAEANASAATTAISGTSSANAGRAKLDTARPV